MSHSCTERRGATLASVASVAAAASLGLALAAQSAGTISAPAADDAFGPWRAVVIGPAHGELEPCGCSGGQLGGIDRLAAQVSAERQTSAGPTLAVATGGTVHEEASEVPDWALAQIESVWGAYGLLELAAVGVASGDLALGLARLGDYALLLGPKTPLVASNLVTEGEAEEEGGGFAFEPLRTDEATGVTVLSFLPPGLAGDGWRTLGDAEAVRRVEAARGAPLGSELLVLVEGGHGRAEALAAHLPPGAILCNFGAAGDPDDGLRPVGEGSHAGFVGERLRHVVRIESLPGAEPSWESIPIDADLPSLEEFAVYRELYRGALRSSSVIADAADRLGPHPRGAYAGSEACADCHRIDYEIWLETLHSHAQETLASDLRGSEPATADPRCVKCHTVGYGWETGYGSASVPRDERFAEHLGLAGVGCESCHGPGAKHVETEAPEDILRSDAETCLECHDSENDPTFVFERKWPLVRHGDE